MNHKRTSCSVDEPPVIPVGYRNRSTLPTITDTKDNIILTGTQYWVILNHNQSLVFGPAASMKDAQLLNEYLNWRRI